MSACNVVLIARVIDASQAVLGEFTTVQSVYYAASDSPAEMVEWALEIADDVRDWEDRSAFAHDVPTKRAEGQP